MTFNKKTLWRDRLVLMLPMLLLGGLLMLAGCSDDPVAPQDEIPDLTADDVAHQAGFVAAAAGVVGPLVIDFDGKTDKDSYSHTFDSDVTGTVHMDYFLGGAAGTPVPWNEADYAHLYTADGEWLTVALGVGGTVTLTFDIGADLDRDADTATINGGGTFATGPHSATFTFNDLVVAKGSSYPSSGSLTFTGGGHTATVTFDGSSFAHLSVAGGDDYSVNLQTGEVLLVVPV